MQSKNTILMAAALLMGCALLVGSQARAGTFAWTNANDNSNWDEPGNWQEWDGSNWTTTSNLPGSGYHDQVVINTGGTDGANSLNFTDNTDNYSNDASINSQWKYLYGHKSDLADPPQKGNSYMDMQSGTLYLSDTLGPMASEGYTDTLEISGGTFYTDQPMNDSLTVTDDNVNSKSIIKISGGTFQVTEYNGPNSPHGGSGSAEFKVSGADPTITIGGDGDSKTGARWYNGDATLKFRIGLSGISPIEVQEGEDNWSSSGAVEFASGATLDMGFMDGASAQKDQTFTLMTWVRDRTSGLSNLSLAAEDTDAWDMTVNDGANGSITATYTIPEPSSLALLGLAGLLLMKRPRRRA